jgi:hypothetical protein
MKFECRKTPSTSAINRLVKFKINGKLIDNKKSFVIKKKSVRIPENIHSTEDPQEMCKTSFSSTQFGSVTNMQDSSKVENCNVVIERTRLNKL